MEEQRRIQKGQLQAEKQAQLFAKGKVEHWLLLWIGNFCLNKSLVEE
jgi:hypothetical protein